MVEKEFHAVRSIAITNLVAVIILGIIGVEISLFYTDDLSEIKPWMIMVTRILYILLALWSILAVFVRKSCVILFSECITIIEGREIITLPHAKIEKVIQIKQSGTASTKDMYAYQIYLPELCVTLDERYYKAADLASCVSYFEQHNILYIPLSSNPEQ